MLAVTAYQIEYEACGLVFLMLVAVRFFSARRFPSRANWLFGTIVLLALMDLCLDIVGAFLIARPDSVEPWVSYLVNTLFYAAQSVLPALLLTYTFFSAESELQKRWHFGVLIPMIALLLLLVTNHWTNAIFYLKEMDGTLRLYRGSAFVTLYIGSLFYVLATLYVVCRYHCMMERRFYRAIIQFCLILLIACVIQYILPQVLLIGLAISLAIMMMFFTLQNPDNMLDLVSGTFNYNAMILYMNSAVAKKQKLHVIMVDVGEIRRVNSKLGLVTGNQIIAMVGGFLNSVSNKASVFRAVGTRFLVLSSAPEGLLAQAEAIKSRFGSEWIVEHNSVHLRATICYSLISYAFESSEELVMLLDEVYMGINSGNWGQCRPIDSEMLTLARRKAKIEADIRASLQSGDGFSLVYQPICAAGSGKVQSVEALLRMHSSTLGDVSPSEFIPVSEKNGSILQIDEYVIRAACECLARHDEIQRMHINLSGSEFFRNPVQNIHDIVMKSGVNPSRICFEVTETVAGGYPQTLHRFMESMIHYGYRFALDDFGMGYSNIARVGHLPFAYAKLDKSMLDGGDKMRRIFEYVSHMFAALEIKTIAEGVETSNQAEHVCHHVDEVQGFLYAMPMPEDQLMAFLAK